MASQEVFTAFQGGHLVPDNPRLDFPESPGLVHLGMELGIGVFLFLFGFVGGGGIDLSRGHLFHPFVDVVEGFLTVMFGA